MYTIANVISDDNQPESGSPMDMKTIPEGKKVCVCVCVCVSVVVSRETTRHGIDALHDEEEMACQRPKAFLPPKSAEYQKQHNAL